jgi:hypothetical protein
MNWLKTSWNALAAGLAAALAIFAVANAARHRKTALEWQEKAVDIESGKVVKGIARAEQANAQAKFHEAKAASIKKQAEARITQIGETDEDVRDILSRWGT